MHQISDHAKCIVCSRTDLGDNFLGCGNLAGFQHHTRTFTFRDYAHAINEAGEQSGALNEKRI